jgi:hypothetical protein
MELYMYIAYMGLNICMCTVRVAVHAAEFVHFLAFFSQYVSEVFTANSLVVWWSELPTTNHEVPGSIPGSTMGIFLVGGGSPW